jgi:hypothetical protein
MLCSLEYFIIGVCIGSVIGVCIRICCIIRNNYNDSKNRNTDVENITKNILHTLDEETGYMTARPIV